MQERFPYSQPDAEPGELETLDQGLNGCALARAQQPNGDLFELGAGDLEKAHLDIDDELDALIAMGESREQQYHISKRIQCKDCAQLQDIDDELEASLRCPEHEAIATE